jgi:hypothetical protein
MEASNYIDSDRRTAMQTWETLAYRRARGGDDAAQTSDRVIRDWDRLRAEARTQTEREEIDAIFGRQVA